MMPDEYKRTARFTRLKEYDYFAADDAGKFFQDIKTIKKALEQLDD